MLTADLYGVPVLGIRERRRAISAAKLFFAYGLGNALTFPLSVGATAVLLAGAARHRTRVAAHAHAAHGDDLLRRPDALRRAARSPDAAARATT